MRTWIRILILADPDPHFNMCGSVIPDSCSNLLLVRFSSVQVWRFLLSPEQWAGAGTFLVGAGAGVYEEEPEPVKKITWSRSRSKVDRLRNTGYQYCKWRSRVWKGSASLCSRYFSFASNISIKNPDPVGFASFFGIQFFLLCPIPISIKRWRKCKK